MINRDKPWDKPWDKGCDWGVAPTFRETHTETPCSSCNVCGNESSDYRLNENKRVQVESAMICESHRDDFATLKPVFIFVSKVRFGLGTKSYEIVQARFYALRGYRTLSLAVFVGRDYWKLKQNTKT